MNDSLKETLKPFLAEYVKEITPQSKTSPNQFVCPFCNSGLGTHQTGAFTVYPETNTYNCFSCGASGDIFNLYGQINKIDDFKTVLDELSNKYKIYKPSISKSKDYRKFFDIAEQYLLETDYLAKRGLSIETQIKFHCGYIPNFIYKENQTTSVIIIPTSKNSYMWN